MCAHEVSNSPFSEINKNQIDLKNESLQVKRNGNLKQYLNIPKICYRWDRIVEAIMYSEYFLCQIFQKVS